MTTSNKPVHVFEHDGVDYVLTEVFGSAVLHNEEEDTYCISKEQMCKMIEHIRQQMGIASCFQARAEILHEKMEELRRAIRELESPKVADEVGDYRDEIRRDKVYDKFLEYYRLHGDEINKLSMERLVPVYTAKRFGESSDCKVVQECLDAYEERIDELTKQCDEIYLHSKEMEKEHLNSMDDVIRERDEARIALRDEESKCVSCGIEHRATIQKLEKRIKELEQHLKEHTAIIREREDAIDTLNNAVKDITKQRDKVQAELTDIKDRKTYEMDLRLDEIDLLNILRGYTECAVFIRKNRGNDAWKAEYLTTKK